MAFTDGQVDRSRGAWDKRDGGGLVALAHDPQRAMAALDAEVLNVGGTSLADTKSIQAEQHGERGVVPVVLLGGEEQHAELGAIQPSSVGGWTSGRRTYWAGFERMRPSM